MKLRGYIFSRPFLGERVPQHVQNLVIRDYCKKNQFQFLLSATEYAMPNSDIMLKQVISELDKINGIVAYSLFQLPINHEDRVIAIRSILEQKKEIHFACEDMRIQNNEDFEKIQNIWQIKLTTM
jgi:sporadic carbohydrate cluster protein (TIGR04323 family)|tara:strand:+ start:195 stop:569 length:375 start_codon:yes stop_codon:yes gene_type:complete